MRSRSEYARSLSAVLFTATAAFGLAACEKVEAPFPGETGPSVTRGPLTLTPIRFAQTDYYLIPGQKTIEAEEGRLRVPLRHGDPESDSIGIHFVRFASTSENPGPPIVYLAGGPGGSGSYSASGDRWKLFQTLREVADVIALDQRGTYYSDPYTLCPGSWDYPLDEPTDVAVRSEAIGEFLAECYAYWSDSLDIKAFNTWESAEDLDDLREALGAERLNLWGISYGTHLGLAYIRQHPDRVERAILAGVEGPDHSYKLPANLDRVLLRVDSAMKADKKLLKVVPDFAGELRDLLAQLEREPLRVEVEDPETGAPTTLVIGADDLRRGVFAELGEREDIIEFPARLVPVMRGRIEDIAPLIVRDRSEIRELAMSLAMDCASGASAERLALIEEQARTAILGDAGNIGLKSDCAGWTYDDLGDEFRSPVYADLPVLFISGTLDIRTPPSNAEEMREGLRNSHHLIIEGGSHDDDLFLASPLILETMVAFLNGERDLPERVTLKPLKFKRP
jgi:pimeloyl-ACP methyl ester carboxylesterase